MTIDVAGLTPREIETVRLICKGLGKRLRLSEATVKTHPHQIYEKLTEPAFSVDPVLPTVLGDLQSSLVPSGACAPLPY